MLASYAFRDRYNYAFWLYLMLFFSPTFFGNKLVLKKEIKTHKRLKWTLFNRTRHKRRRKHWKQKKTWPTISICPPRDCPTSTDQNFEAGDVAQCVGIQTPKPWVRFPVEAGWRAVYVPPSWLRPPVYGRRIEYLITTKALSSEALSISMGS